VRIYLLASGGSYSGPRHLRKAGWERSTEVTVSVFERQGSVWMVTSCFPFINPLVVAGMCLHCPGESTFWRVPLKDFPATLILGMNEQQAFPRNPQRRRRDDSLDLQLAPDAAAPRIMPPSWCGWLHPAFLPRMNLAEIGLLCCCTTTTHGYRTGDQIRPSVWYG